MNKKYINISFAVFIFVITSMFFKEYVFDSSSIIYSGLAGLIGGIFGFGILFIVKEKNLILKIGILVLLSILLLLYHINYKKNTPLNDSLIGNYSAKKDSLLVNIYISKTNMKMVVFPLKQEKVFDYILDGNQLEFFNDEEVIYFTWKIVKTDKDSLVVIEENETLRFKKKK